MTVVRVRKENCPDWRGMRRGAPVRAGRRSEIGGAEPPLSSRRALPSPSDPGERDRTGDDSADPDEDKGHGAVEETSETGDFGLRHDTIPSLVDPAVQPGGPIWTALR